MPAPGETANDRFSKNVAMPRLGARTGLPAIALAGLLGAAACGVKGQGLGGSAAGDDAASGGAAGAGGGGGRGQGGAAGGPGTGGAGGSGGAAGADGGRVGGGGGSPGAGGAPARGGAGGGSPDGSRDVVSGGSVDARAPDAPGTGGGGGAGRDAPVDSPPPRVTPDMGAPDLGLPTPGVVSCGPLSCSVSSAKCCAYRDGQICRPRDVSCGEGQSQYCDGPEDCGRGQVCCARVDPNSAGVYRSECRDFDECDSDYARLCHVQSDCPFQRCCPRVVSGVSFNQCRSQCS